MAHGPFKLRFEKEIWNAYTPATPASSHTPISSPALAIASSPPTNTALSPSSPQTCKVKIYRFQHGGLRRAGKGRMKNEVVLERPCLKVGCENCWHWRGGEMRELHIPGESDGGVGGCVDGDGDGDGDGYGVIDPRLLDGRWRDAWSENTTISAHDSGTDGVEDEDVELAHVRERDGQEMQLTPVQTTFTPQPYYPTAPPSPHAPSASRKLVEYAYEYEPSTTTMTPRVRAVGGEEVGVNEGGEKREKENEKTTAKTGRRKMTPEQRKSKKRDYDRKRREMQKRIARGG